MRLAETGTLETVSKDLAKDREKPERLTETRKGNMSQLDGVPIWIDDGKHSGFISLHMADYRNANTGGFSPGPDHRAITRQTKIIDYMPEGGNF